MNKIEYALRLAKDCTFADEMTEGAKAHLRGVIDEALVDFTKDLPKPADQSREEYFETLYQEFNTYVGTPYPEQEQAAQEKILAMSFDKIRELETRHTKLQHAYGQYVFFMHGYRDGSASISEVNAAQSEFLILLNGNDH